MGAALGDRLMSSWFIYAPSKNKGPFSLEQLLTEIAGRNLARTHVWREGLDDWKRASEVPELASLVPPPPPSPAPPEAEAAASPPVATRDDVETPAKAEATVPSLVATREDAASPSKAEATSSLLVATRGDVAGPAKAEAAVSPLIVTRDDAAPTIDETPEKQHDKRFVTWGLAGTFIGLLLVGYRAFKGDVVGDAAYLTGYILATIFIPAILGFVLGAAVDAFKDRPKRQTGNPTTDNSNADNPQIAVEAAQPAATPRRNWIIRHWRGDLRLWVSYWVISFVGNFTVGVVAALLGQMLGHGDYNPVSLFAVVASIVGFAVLVSVWQFVGVWRSAAKYKVARAAAGRSRGFGYLAQAAVMFGALASVATLIRDGGPQLVETYRMAFLNDPGVPDYSIRVMRDGTEAEIVGGFKYGLTNDFEKILKASDRIRVVHLDSVGGRLGEGEKMFNLIRARGLATYVSAQCMSACTLAFAGGRERFLRRGATLGFHRGSFPGARERDLDTAQRKVFQIAGFDAKFIDTALSTPHSGMWRPSPEVLIGAHVVSRLSDGREFASSGLGGNISKEMLAESMSKTVPVLRVMKARFPKEFDGYIDVLHQSLVQGKSEGEVIDLLQGRLAPFVMSQISLADDDVLADYTKLMVEEYSALGAKNSTYCYVYAAGAAKQDVPANLYAELPAPLRERERALQERVLSSAQPRPPVKDSDIAPIFGKVRKQLAAQGMTESDFALFASTNVDRAKHSAYCNFAIRFFREISNLPPRESALAMRSIMAGAAAK